MSIRDEPPTPFWSEEEISRLLAIPSPPPSPLSPWSSPLPQIPSPPLLVSSPVLAYVAMLRAAAPSTYILVPRSKAPPSGTPPLLPIPLPTPSPPFLLPSTDSRVDVRKACLPPRKRLCFAFGLRYEVDGLKDLVSRDVRQDTDEIYRRLDDAHTELQMVTSRLNMLFRDRRAHACTARLMEIEARMSREA
ncbi:hypothetical protein Tco_1122675 [Tanacetum coccineum]|uniref:Uncharacterized protein n=1 Tax=Tanacetum coccineum TaxID=301880 RepID=A0ABQ5J2V6_9ASTR